MELTVLASGSKGNCTCLRGERGSLLIDVGLSARETLRRLANIGEDATLIEAILVTHEHIDHIKGVDVLARQLGVPIYATAGTLEGFYKKVGPTSAEVRRCRYGESFSVGDFQVEPFAASHDAREPCGFCVTESGLRIGCCTDTGTITATIFDRLASCDAVLLESNHCPWMLEDGPYPAFLKRRIRSTRGHLSNPDAARCLQGLAGHIHVAMLAHLSETNNTEERALFSALEGLGFYSDQVAVTVAQQDPGPVHPESCGFRL
ncbi:MAG TPA: MBL fold metallo-hydrolase [Candidatus Methanoculleus thermohydrogenotrophicum]|jgi:phosphoribosyl 1,2-cyclic phosphodiesterase|nr:MBL fold metallo-hydrolase [Candidatus Methanoculleus thermohydrogenotrophicum]NLM81497.1 MBL fold metallo-hydrolase [Candidatus Methanoculleus thermohydrogenotrophicum]HOB18594.1 MBL fold metallo-hydrolase [Candidatus Methanoculleus thermohydrogenotrophicum]HPZ38693.1 MBL fold metallo-hydrolase [Candidatus Methanoculleus thermohydrogenotrophicum]HQC91868.1 MBL fold metallo-hydrolase [Candidatus Methanoculleus thermohydrogenotrophicum]